MNVPETSPTTPRYELKDELARLCLPSVDRDANQKLAWINSVCLLFIIIGIAGARREMIAIKDAPPLVEIVPVVLQPAVLPPQPAMNKNEPPRPDGQYEPPVAVVLPQTPNITFSVPTIGALVAPARLAAAPPLEPLRAKTQVGSIGTTGGSGDRPEPPYPRLARQEGEQGAVVLLLGGDEAGNVISVDLKESSGFPLLDRATEDFVKNHWRLPAGGGLFQTCIIYQLQL